MPTDPVRMWIAVQYEYECLLQFIDIGNDAVSTVYNSTLCKAAVPCRTDYATILYSSKAINKDPWKYFSI